MRTRIITIFLLFWSAAMLHAAGGTARSWRIETVPAPEDPPLTLSGQVVVRAEEGRAIIALDAEDSRGGLDGRVDHLFSVFALDLVPVRLSLDDSLARIEFQQGGLRLVLPMHKQEVEFRVFTFEQAPWLEEKMYPARLYESGLQLFHYSGAMVQQVLLDDVQRLGIKLLSSEMADLRFPLGESAGQVSSWGSEKSTLEPFDPDPTAGGGTGTCTSSCSKSCTKGKCSASCRTGHCAKCKCLDEPAGTPFCTCV